MPAAPIPDFKVAKTNFTLPPLNALFDAMFVLLSRGDKSAIELFQAGVRGWDAGLRRLDNEKRRPGDSTPERRPCVIDAPKQLAIRRVVASPLF